MCVIWSFDDMGLGEQVILSDKKIEMCIRDSSTYGAAFRQKPIFFMSGKETVAYFEGKLKKNMMMWFKERNC